jgi:NADH dehydrogenase [ubiquinone] 1 alpha subcomplex assembly factor 7
MALANREYYATHPAIGAGGDFITAPEISQMFGEIVGLWCADLWQRGRQPDIHLVELGPGRGTLADDALRAMRRAGLEPPVHLVETSPALREKQKELIEDATWHDKITTLPTDRPLLIIANEFFDALPVRQFVRTLSGWRERMVRVGGDDFEPVPGSEPRDSLVPVRLLDADPGGIYEDSPAAARMMRALARRVAAQGGAILVIDYGYAGYAAGDTLQAVHAHAYADPFARPGRSDLSAHVDFTALARAGEAEGLTAFGPVTQGDWLTELGIGTRAALLGRANPNRVREIEAARRRLIDPQEMGELFKVLALAPDSWPDPTGFPVPPLA